jgi:hypothetical protein
MGNSDRDAWFGAPEPICVSPSLGFPHIGSPGDPAPSSGGPLLLETLQCSSLVHDLHLAPWRASLGVGVMKSRLRRTNSRSVVQSRVSCAQPLTALDVPASAVEAETQALCVYTVGQVGDNMKKAKGL